MAGREASTSAHIARMIKAQEWRNGMCRVKNDGLNAHLADSRGNRLKGCRRCWGRHLAGGPDVPVCCVGS